MRRYAKPLQDLLPGRTGRPSRLSQADEWNLYCCRKSGIAIKMCASMFRVSVPTANRIIAKFREYNDSVEPLAREFREKLDALRNPDRPDDPPGVTVRMRGAENDSRPT